MKQELKEEIFDLIEKRVQSKTQSLESSFMRLEKNIPNVIKETVNGKIEKLHKEVIERDDAQAKQIEQMQGDIGEMLEISKDTIGFFRTTMRFAKWIIAVGGAMGGIWAFFKFLVNATKI